MAWQFQSDLHLMSTYMYFSMALKYLARSSRYFSAPDQPPADITAKTLGMTGIRVGWAPVPLNFRGGIIRGYKISYSSNNSTTRLINASYDALYATLTSLTKFTFYDVYVQAFTIKGDGPAYHLSTATDMGGERMT